MRIVFAVLLSLVAAASAVAGTHYRVIDLGTLEGAEGSAPWAINNRGDVVGRSDTDAFLSRDGRMRSVTPPQNQGISEAFGINDKREVVGIYFASEEVHAFLYRRGAGFLDIGSLGGAQTIAVDINNKAQIAGYGWLPGSPVVVRAFLYDGGMTELGTLGGTNSFANGINNRGHVVGYSEVAPGSFDFRAFLYRDGEMINLGTLGGLHSIAYDINEHGDVVGMAETAAGKQEAFLYRNGRMLSLGSLGAGAQAFAVNNSGQIVGQTFVRDIGDARAFIHEHGRMRDLNTLTDPAAGWLLIEAWGINDRGQIAVYGCKTGVGCHALRLDPIERRR